MKNSHQSEATPKAVIRVFDPAMCCSTGVCGPSVDPQLAKFSADLDWVKGQGVDVERFNLSQQPGVFAVEGKVKSALESRGEASLPLILVDGEVAISGAYPTREQLAAWAGVKASASSELKEKTACCSTPQEMKSHPEDQGACCEVPKDQSAKGKSCC